VNVAHDCAVKVQVARQVGRVGWRERRIDIEPIARKVVIFLGNVHLRGCWKNRAPQESNDE
jgi:hypothetical protein